MLWYSKGYRLAGRTLTSLHMRLHMFDSCTAVLRAEMVNFCKVALEESQPREDYKEFLNLCMIFLGGADPTEVSFRAPRAFHQMHAQSNLQSEVVLVPAPVHFD